MRRPLGLTIVAVLLACAPESSSSGDGIVFDGGLDDSSETQAGNSSDGDGDGDPGDGDGDPGDGDPLACDAGFSFTPNPPGTGSLLNVAFTDAEPLVYVELAANGPQVATIQWAGVTTSDPWTWNWTVTDLAPGIWTFTFSAGDPSVLHASCQVEVLDTGAPPDPPIGGCEGKVCGQSDGMGGVCQTCPMVGDCLDPPSPYNPDGPGPWSCLDNAGCTEDSGTCRIWCPGEPCNNEAHPDGCPQGVESCWVDASISSYEEACKTCCESRYHQPTGEYACWDQAFNLCRYPSDCGLPLW